MPTYARANLSIERGEGAHVWTTDGRRLLDFGSGVAVTSLGHCHPRLVEAVREQAGRLWHCSNLYRVPGQERLAERLVAASFADMAFFCNSGAEAVECLIKAARRYHFANGNDGRYRVIACEGAFHGRTLATVAAGGQPKHMEGFAPAVEGFDRVSFGNPNEARAAITDETAAILVEPVQGEGGINPAGVDYLKALRETADEFGILLLFDEVQTGMGRTGTLFAHEHSGVAPDAMALAKGLGGGFPVGACLATEKVGRHMSAGSHGSTFGGNPLAMAAANAVLNEMLSDGFMDRVNAVADVLRARADNLAARHPKVFSEVRGLGLMLGLAAVPENAKVVAALMEAGLLTVPAGGNVVRLLPPLIIDETHVDEAMDILERVAKDLEAAS